LSAFLPFITVFKTPLAANAAMYTIAQSASGSKNVNLPYVIVGNIVLHTINPASAQIPATIIFKRFPINYEKFPHFQK